LLNEREMLSAIQKTLKAGDVFLDVGSSLGIFTVFGAKAVDPKEPWSLASLERVPTADYK